jgi:hypothetical protein
MPRKKAVPALVTYADLSARLGVPVNTLRQWQHRGKLPEPDFRVGREPVWLPASVADLQPAAGEGDDQ